MIVFVLRVRPLLRVFGYVCWEALAPFLVIFDENKEIMKLLASLALHTFYLLFKKYIFLLNLTTGMGYNWNIIG